MMLRRVFRHGPRIGFYSTPIQSRSAVLRPLVSVPPRVAIRRLLHVPPAKPQEKSSSGVKKWIFGPPTVNTDRLKDAAKLFIGLNFVLFCAAVFLGWLGLVVNLFLDGDYVGGMCMVWFGLFVIAWCMAL